MQKGVEAMKQKKAPPLPKAVRRVVKAARGRSKQAARFDPLGSYTGRSAGGGAPTQDADDL